ncbi:disrupted in schizophrenia 1 protein-like [Vombatus ursinus]|uniref:disrupted in schizophrenia 1 protein-like n=1 Tax=Vombatus ursinus TaxID=29139 RepID=UPI000FFD2129|nr:disrupted in schizophrenia 1 protein-like [Vombatus ursinus]
MLGRGQRGAPAAWDKRPEQLRGSGRSNSGGHSPGKQGQLLPTGSFQKKRLARRPGYMRTDTRPRIECLSAAAHPSFNLKELGQSKDGMAELKTCTMARLGDSDLIRQGFGSSIGNPILKGSRVIGHSIPGNFWSQPGSSTKLTDSVTDLTDSSASVCLGSFPPPHRPEVPLDPWEVVEGIRTQDPSVQKEANNSCDHVGCQQTPTTPPSPHDVFNSSFSFIRLSLRSAGERGEAEGCLLTKEVERTCQSPTDVRTENTNVNESVKRQGSSGACEDLRLASQPCDCRSAQGPVGTLLASSTQPEKEVFSFTHTDAAISCSLDSSSIGSSVTSGYESSIMASDHSWDTLVKKYEPVLMDCLLSNRALLKIKSLMLKLQKLQEKAVEEDNYDRAEELKQKLENLEKEKSTLKFQLPSRHPSISSFLDHFGAQVQSALHWATHGVSSEETQPQLRMDTNLTESAVQDRLQVSITRRDWLLQEKQQLQKEIEGLQARMSVLEAKDQQLRRDIEEQERFIQFQDCELTSLLGCVPLGELQEVRKALDDMLALSYEIPFSLELPGTMKSLQEKEQSLSLTIKETTSKVCTSQKLCSSLRKKVNEIETHIPALLEAKMLAVSGNSFSTAKDLTEEIRSLTSEREGLEGLINKLLVLSARNVRKLERIKEDYNRLRQEIEQGETAYENSVKEHTVKYMEILEDKLRSSRSQLLERVWEADLEACQLLIRGFQLQEVSSCVSEGEEIQIDRFEMATPAPAPVTSLLPRPTSEDGLKPFCQPAEEWQATLYPTIQGGGCEQKEESYIISLELREKCEAISEKLLYLEDQLHAAIYSHDEGLVQALKREIQMVKETLQAMIVQLQPAEAGDFLCASWCPENPGWTNDGGGGKGDGFTVS